MKGLLNLHGDFEAQEVVSRVILQHPPSQDLNLWVDGQYFYVHVIDQLLPFLHWAVSSHHVEAGIHWTTIERKLEASNLSNNLTLETACYGICCHSQLSSGVCSRSNNTRKLRAAIKVNGLNCHLRTTIPDFNIILDIEGS